MTVFAVLAKEDHEAGQARSRALTAARVRAQDTVGPLLAKSASKADFEIRLSWVDDTLRKIAQDTAREHGHPGIEEVYDKTREFLAEFGGDSDFQVNHYPGATPCENCGGRLNEKGFCPDCYAAGPSAAGASRPPEPTMVNSINPMLSRVAAEPVWEDSYQHDREKLPTADDTGLGDTGAVPTDKANSGDETGWNLRPIDVDSQRHQLTKQDAADKADYNASDFDPKNPVRERIDVTKPLQPEYSVADNTDTWSSGEGNSAGQADAVTETPSGSFLSKYRVASVSLAE